MDRRSEGVRNILSKKNEEVIKKLTPSEIIDEEQLNAIRDSLIFNHAELVVKGLQDDSSREELAEIIKNDHKHIVKNDPSLIEYIVQETVGTGIIEEIMKDESVTDIQWDGTKLIIESNDDKIVYNGQQKITEDYIVRIVQKYANANGRDFNPGNPIFDGAYGNVRINAVHKQNSTAGTTMSLRVVRPSLPLREDTFEYFAPQYIYHFFKQIIKIRTNMVISGETGTGKTALQKLLASFIQFEHTVGLVEEVAETYIKQMFPELVVLSWVTSPGVSITDLVVTALRNNIRWLIVSESRGQEAYEMIQGMLTGHHMITTLHSANARAVPRRLITMSKMGYEIDEKSLQQDIVSHLNFSMHIKRVVHEGKVLRYLSEIVEYSDEGAQTIFKQRHLDGKYHVETGTISQSLKDRFEEEGIIFDFPEDYTHERQASSNKVLTEISVFD